MGINVGLDSVFSIFKKEDFKNIIVCFDNIERKSDKLPLDEILGLVNLLKEDKSCNVVMIFDKDKLDKRESNNNEVSPKDWYETYKEKVIDYEIVIDNNDEIAQEIIEDNLRWDTKERKQEIVNLIFECFKKEFNNNLRLLIKFTQHIDYFNQHCFLKHYNESRCEEFLNALEWYYGAMAVRIKQYYLLLAKDEKGLSSGWFLYYEKFLNNLLELNEKDKETLQEYFSEAIKNETRKTFDKKRQDYRYGNLNDEEYAKAIKNVLQDTKNYTFENGMQYDYDDYVALFEQYKKITGEELHSEKEKITKQFIEALVQKESGVDINDDFRDMGFNTIRDLIQKEEKYKQFYKECKDKECRIIYIESFIKNLSKDTIKETFSPKDIVKYNNFSIDETANVFQNNNEFCKIFSEYFSDNFFDDFAKEYNLKNYLFQEYKKFLNKEEYKVKKEIIKERLEEMRTKEILEKEYDEYKKNQNQDSPYKKFFEYFRKEYVPRNNMHPYTPNIPISAYKEFCGKDENKEEKEKMEENLKKNPLTSVLLKLINAEE